MCRTLRRQGRALDPGVPGGVAWRSAPPRRCSSSGTAARALARLSAKARYKSNRRSGGAPPARCGEALKTL